MTRKWRTPHAAASIHDGDLTKLPEGYRTLVGERGITLSGGQSSWRVAIARTLLKDPRIFIWMTRPLRLDTETEGEIREALQRLMQGRTTFIIADRIQSVMNADQILVLDQGLVVQRGTHDQRVRQDLTDASLRRKRGLRKKTRARAGKCRAPNVSSKAERGSNHDH